MNWVDIGCGVLLAVGGIMGAVSGLLWQIARMVSLAVALYVCLYFHAPIGEWLAARMPETSPTVLKGLSYFVAFAGTYVVLFVVTCLIEKAIKAVELKPIDRILGGALGLFKAGLVAGIVLLGIVVVPISSLTPDIEASTLGPVILKGTRAIIVAIPEEQKKKVSDWFAEAKKRAEDTATQAVKQQLGGGSEPTGANQPPDAPPANQGK